MAALLVLKSMLTKIIILDLIIFGLTKGLFSFDCNSLNVESSCNGTTNLIWNYTTDETVTVIEWYKRPGGILIARIFGVNIGAPFTVLAPYNAAPYNVTLYEPSKYNAAIRITGMTSADSGLYSCNVTAASPQSAILNRNFVPTLTEKPYVIGFGGKGSCYSPPKAVDVSFSWKKSGDILTLSCNGIIVPFLGVGTYECCLMGGNADCAREPLCNSIREISAISGNSRILKWKLNVLPTESGSVHVIHPTGLTLFTVQGSLLKTFVNGVTNTSNNNTTTGNIEFTLENVTVEDAGYYDTESYIPGEGSHRSTGVAMVVFDKPSRPTITVMGTPVVNRSMFLTCSSTSNSKPDGHYLMMKYKWYLNGTELQVGDRYRFSQYDPSLSIYHIKKDDNNTEITCKSYEIDTLLSDVSNEYTTIVKYGPETVNISPGTTRHYSLAENNGTLGPIRCSADCVPACTYTWRKYNGIHIVAAGDTLTINNNTQQTSASSYWCTACNMYGVAVSKTITVG